MHGNRNERFFERQKNLGESRAVRYDMMQTNNGRTERRLWRIGRWVTIGTLALLLCAGLMTACGGTRNTPNPVETPGVTVSDSASTGDPAPDSDPDIESGETAAPGTDPETENPENPDNPDNPDSPAITLPPPETQGETDPPEDITMPPSETDDPAADTAEETLPYDPELHPGDSAAYKGLMISAVHGTGKKGAEATIDHGFIQLYNNTDKAISLKGASLYYKSEGANPFEQFVFPEDASVPAGGYYLIRANAPTDMVESNLIMKISKFDIEWDTHIDNKEVRLLLAPSGWTVGRDEDITVFDDAISVFVASVTPHTSVYTVDDLSRNKIAVRTAKQEYSGYHLVNLTRTATHDLKAVCPVNSKGEENEVVSTRLQEVYFSHGAGIYEDTFYLELSAPEGYTVYYTTDGSNPETSSTRKRYAGRIYMSDTSAMQPGPMAEAWYNHGNRLIGGKVVKAYAVKGTEKTPVYTNTYFVTDDLAAYGVTIMSISIPKEEMLGSGFYANYLPNGAGITDTRPRGVGILEVFDASGNRVGNSRVEMAVSGNGSSDVPMKSLRIYFKGVNNQDAGLQSDLNYDLFAGRATNDRGEAITSFSRLLLRNSGNDVGHSYIRDAYMQRVSAGLNIDTMAAASTLVFVNGEFWGVYNARERYSPEYVESHYGIQKENVAIIESDYSKVHTDQNADFVLSSGIEGDEDNFNALIHYMRARGNSLTDADYAYICTQMDVDSFIDMWVARLYFHARDWPENNIKVWRNRNPDDPSGFDTKWHFTLLDMDMGLSFYDFTTERDDFFWAFDSNSVTGMMMRCLISNPTFKEQFLMRYYEVVKEYYTATYLSAELEAYIAERDRLMPLQVGRWGVTGTSIATWNSDCADMRSFVANRNPYALQHFYNYFGVNEDQMENLGEKRITLSFHTGRADVTVNGQTATSGTLIKFEKGTTATITVKATAKEGFTVTEIVYLDRNGNKQSVEGSEATFKATESGSISVMIKREGGEKISEGQLVAGATYLFYLSPDGDLYAWGDNRQGALGFGHAGGTVNTPTFVMSGVAKVVTSAGNAYENGDTTFATAVLLTDGRVLTVGANTAGQLGRNGTVNDAQWGEIDFDGKVVDVSMGHDHLLIVDDKGVLWGIGANNYGALGATNAGGNVDHFIQIATNVEIASAGRRSTVFLTQDGRLWGLGDNRWKKLSQAHGDQIHTPAVIAENIKFIDSGEHQVLAIAENGKLYYAGWRTIQGFNQGAGNNPTMAELMSGVKEADIYQGNMVILAENGEAYVYGLNVDNGIGSTVTNGTPQRILTDVADIAAGYGFTAYLTTDGRILIQGSNANGQAGNGAVGGSVSLGEVDF